MSMNYSLARFPQFVEDYRDYFSYLGELEISTSIRHFERMEKSLAEIVQGNPFRYAYFRETGAPYHAKLFKVGKKAFWIIYTANNDVVSLRRFWDCAREPGTHGL